MLLAVLEHKITLSEWPQTEGPLGSEIVFVIIHNKIFKLLTHCPTLRVTFNYPQ